MTPRLISVAANPAIDRLLEVERLVPGTIHRPGTVRVAAGGQGLNVARAATLLGVRVTAVALLAGHAGRWIEGALAAEEIDGRFAWVDGETRMLTTIADRATGSLTELTEAGPPIDEAGWAALESTVRGALGGDGRLVTMSGSLPPGAPAEGYARLIRIAAATGHLAAVDGGAALLPALAAHAWLAKVDASEAAAVTGRPVEDVPSAALAARELARRGAANAVVTLGVAGAVALLDGKAWHVGSPPRLGPYTVGSGDAFLAGFAVGRLEGLAVAETLALAAGAAAANALEPGAGVLDAALARSLAGEVTVERLG